MKDNKAQGKYGQRKADKGQTEELYPSWNMCPADKFFLFWGFRASLCPNRFFISRCAGLFSQKPLCGAVGYVR